MIFFERTFQQNRLQFWNFPAPLADKFVNCLPGDIAPPRQICITEFRMCDLFIQKFQCGEIQPDHEPDYFQQILPGISLFCKVMFCRTIRFKRQRGFIRKLLSGLFLHNMFPRQQRYIRSLRAKFPVSAFPALLQTVVAPAITLHQRPPFC